MRWEDERYVRLYTRDTPEFLALSWVARGLFALILRKVDRAGILPVGKLGLRGVAVAIGGSWPEVEAPLRELTEDGCVVFDPDRSVVYIPNFLTAQEAKQSDAARKRASRERARAELTDSQRSQSTSHTVTPSDGASHDVTQSHTESHAVTSGHTRSLLAVPSLAVPSRNKYSSGLTGPVGPATISTDEPPKAQEGPVSPSEPSEATQAQPEPETALGDPVTGQQSASGPATARSVQPIQPEPPSAPPSDAAGDEPPSSSEPAIGTTLPLIPGATELTKAEQIQIVWCAYLDAWQKHINGSRPPTLDAKRRRLIRARLKHFTVDDLCRACRGVFESDYNMREGHYGLDLVMRDAAHVERFMAMAAPEKPKTHAQTALDVFDEMWRCAYRKERPHDVDDLRAAGDMVAMCRDAAKRCESEPRAVFRHLVKQFLADRDPKLIDARHPLRFLARQASSYDLPRRKAEQAHESPKVAAEAEPERQDPEAMRQALAFIQKLGNPTVAAKEGAA